MKSLFKKWYLVIIMILVLVLTLALVVARSSCFGPYQPSDYIINIKVTDKLSGIKIYCPQDDRLTREIYARFLLSGAEMMTDPVDKNITLLISHKHDEKTLSVSTMIVENDGDKHFDTEKINDPIGYNITSSELEQRVNKLIIYLDDTKYIWNEIK